MTASTCCPHERDVLDLVAIGQWPQRADATLRTHVASCATCAEVASIAIAVREWSDADAAPRVPEASVVWHRAQVRARAAAERAASRPVWIAQGFAVAAVLGALLVMGPGATWYQSAWQSAVGVVPAWPTVSWLPEWPTVTFESMATGWSRTVLLAASALVLLLSGALAALRLSERSESR
jgi:non-ribosomal peptide synthetase component F